MSHVAMNPGAQAALLMNKKSMGVAVLLTFLFGPLGLFYASILGGIVMLIVGGGLMILTVGLAAFVVWPVCMIWAAVSVSGHNKRLLLGLPG